MAIEKITKDEIAAASVEESLPDRPSQTTLYGGKVMSPRELKKVYDKLPKLIAEKLNELIDKIGIEGEGSLAGDIPTGIRKGHTLADLFHDIPGGDAAYYLKVGENTLADFCFAVEAGRLQLGEKAPTEQGVNGGLYLVVKEGSIKEIYCYKDGSGWVKYNPPTVYYTPKYENNQISFEPNTPDLPAIPPTEIKVLPPYTATQTGYVLAVVNGVLTWTPAEKCECGPELPPLTASDEGKVLTAEGGAWVAKDLPINSVKINAPRIWLDGSVVYASTDSASDREEFYLDGEIIAESVGTLDLSTKEIADGIHTVTARSIPVSGNYTISEFGNTIVYVKGELTKELPTAEGVSF